MLTCYQVLRSRIKLKTKINSQIQIGFKKKFQFEKDLEISKLRDLIFKKSFDFEIYFILGNKFEGFRSKGCS